MTGGSGDATIQKLLAAHGGAVVASNGQALEFRSDDAVVERARKYVDRMPPAVSGENGHGTTFRVACVLVKGFHLSPEQSESVLGEFNQRCQPPWTDAELQHKIDSALKASGPSGYLRNTNPQRWEAIAIPEHVAPKNERTAKPAKVERSKPTRKKLEAVVSDAIEHSASGKKHLINLGIPDLNRAVGGGVEFGEMITIAARPSHGKSMVALQMVAQLTADGLESAFFSEEMGALTVGKRVIQFATDVQEPHWTEYRDKVEGDVSRHFARRADCHVVEGCCTVERMATEIRELAAVGVRAVVVDYVQLLQSSGRGRYETVTENSVALRKVCTETGVLMIVLAQMSREIEGRESFIPKTSDLRESGQLEQDADVLLFLVWPWKLDATKEKTEFLIFVKKNRNRELVHPVVKCTLDASRQRLSGFTDKEFDWARGM